jgi:hypothetical protein
VIGQFAGTALQPLTAPRVRARIAKKENKMRIMIVAIVAMTTTIAIAEESDDAHRLALSGRDAYWNCLAREYPRDSNKNLSEADFVALIAGACRSERQNFRVALLDYLATLFPEKEPGANMTTANSAIELAQKDIVTAFTKRKAASK